MAQDNLRNMYVGPDNAETLEKTPEWLQKGIVERIMALARIDGQLDVRTDFAMNVATIRAWLEQRNNDAVRGRFVFVRSLIGSLASPPSTDFSRCCLCRHARGGS
jgi:hypothetical protein